VGAWYSIGILAGLGTAIGVALMSGLRRTLAALVTAVVVSVVLGFAFSGWAQAVAGLVGALCGVVGSAPLVTGALRRGGTRGGTATLLALVSLIGAALAFVPVLGYLEAVAILALGFRLRRRAPDRHAGLRTLAK
jgi:small-conductance mechanosensitive channel